MTDFLSGTSLANMDDSVLPPMRTFEVFVGTDEKSEPVTHMVSAHVCIPHDTGALCFYDIVVLTLPNGKKLAEPHMREAIAAGEWVRFAEVMTLPSNVVFN